MTITTKPIADMTRDQLRAECKSRGIKYGATDTKASLTTKLAVVMPEANAIELGRTVVIDATKAAMRLLPEGSSSHVAPDDTLVVADGEAVAVVRAITEHMRAIVKADRSANMYREGKLRQVRTAVIARFPEAAAGLPQPKAKGAASAGKLARVEALNDQLAAARAAKAAAKTQPARAKRVG